MKTSSKIPMIFTTVLLSMAFGCLGGCSQQIDFQKSAKVPAATISATVSRDGNNNYKLDIKVENLAKPEALTPPKKVYVVWVRHAKGYQNIGQILLDRKLKGSLSSVTPYKPMSVMITAENSSSVLTPGNMTVLESKNITELP